MRDNELDFRELDLDIVDIIDGIPVHIATNGFLEGDYNLAEIQGHNKDIIHCLFDYMRDKSIIEPDIFINFSFIEWVIDTQGSIYENRKKAIDAYAESFVRYAQRGFASFDCWKKKDNTKECILIASPLYPIDISNISRFWQGIPKVTGNIKHKIIAGYDGNQSIPYTRYNLPQGVQWEDYEFLSNHIIERINN